MDLQKKEWIPSIKEARYKVRLVAKGHIQIPSIDFTDVISPIVKHSSILNFTWYYGITRSWAWEVRCEHCFLTWWAWGWHLYVAAWKLWGFKKIWLCMLVEKVHLCSKTIPRQLWFLIIFWDALMIVVFISKDVIMGPLYISSYILMICWL